MLIENNGSGTRQSHEFEPTKKEPSVRKERSSSAKYPSINFRPKNQDKLREREIFTINNLLDLQVISKPKWKF